MSPSWILSFRCKVCSAKHLCKVVWFLRVNFLWSSSNCAKSTVNKSFTMSDLKNLSEVKEQLIFWRRPTKWVFIWHNTQVLVVSQETKSVYVACLNDKCLCMEIFCNTHKKVFQITMHYTQGCGAGTQISVSGSSCRHLNFLGRPQSPEV